MKIQGKKSKKYKYYTMDMYKYEIKFCFVVHKYVSLRACMQLSVLKIEVNSTSVLSNKIRYRDNENLAVEMSTITFSCNLNR